MINQLVRGDTHVASLEHHEVPARLREHPALLPPERHLGLSPLLALRFNRVGLDLSKDFLELRIQFLANQLSGTLLAWHINCRGCNLLTLWLSCPTLIMNIVVLSLLIGLPRVALKLLLLLALSLTVCLPLARRETVHHPDYACLENHGGEAEIDLQVLPLLIRGRG